MVRLLSPQSVPDLGDNRRPPAVSVIIATYNAGPLLAHALDALAAQSLPPQSIEIIVVDDGSTDGTELKCGAIEDPRVHYVNKGRIGRQRALNAGIAFTNAEFIAINDADDLSLPHRLRYSMELFRNNEQAALVGTGFSTTTEFVESIPEAVLAGSLSEDHAPVYWPSRITLYRRNVFTHSTVMFPKRTWERIGGYDESLTLSEDYDFYLRAMQCGPVALLPGRTVHWYTNPNGVFKQRSHQENLEVLRFIKRRAHGLLRLPGWLRLYQPLWEMGFHVTSSYPALLDVAKGLRRFAPSKYSVPS